MPFPRDEDFQMPSHNRNKLLNDVFQENVEVSFDLPELSPMATLSIIDLSCSQVPCPLCTLLLQAGRALEVEWDPLEHPRATRGAAGKGGTASTRTFLAF